MGLIPLALCLSVPTALNEAEFASCTVSVGAKTAATSNAIFVRVMCQPSPEVRLLHHTKEVAGEIRPSRWRPTAYYA